MTKILILVGLPGSGKTCAGSEFARVTDSVFVDTDEFIENKLANKSVERIFSEDGEEKFRQYEKMALDDLVCPLDPDRTLNKVVATGGGLPCREENFALLESLGTIVFLHCKSDVLAERLAAQFTREKKGRPLLDLASANSCINLDNLRKNLDVLLEKRQAVYNKAGHCIDTSDLSIGQVVERLKAFF